MPKTTRGLAIAGFTDQDIFNLVREATRNARRIVPDNEILKTIATIRGTGASAHSATAEKPVYEPAYLEERAARLPDTVDAEYLAARSQYTVWNRSPVGFLHKLYRPGAKVWVTTNEKSGDGLIWTHTGASQRFDELAHLENGQPGVWFLTNPIDGELRAIPRLQTKWNPKGLTFTALECIVAWSFLLLESDQAPAHLWLKALVQIALPIVAVYHSGKRSIHALALIQAASKADWDKIRDRYETELIRLGACAGSLTARRLSRLPNCVRGETGKLQQLLYLSPGRGLDTDLQAPAARACRRSRETDPRNTRSRYSRLRNP
jgi:hypothetical protein